MKNKFILTFGEKLKKIRREKNLKQEYVASLLNIKQPNYSHLENDKVKPNLQQLKKIVEIFNVSIEMLVDDYFHFNSHLHAETINSGGVIDFVIHQQILDSKNLIIQVQENKIKELIREKEYLIANRTIHFQHQKSELYQLKL
jgi:transcriptional regulator with XRE-family HTH domain